MNRKPHLRVVVMEGMEMEKKNSYLSLIVLQPCRQFLPIPLFSCLKYAILVGENVFIYECDCVLPHLDGKTSM